VRVTRATRKIGRLRELTQRAGRPEGAVKVGLGAFLRFDNAPGPDRLPLKGNPEQIADDVRQYQAIGINDFVLNPISRQDPMAVLERFAREVRPLLA